MIATGIGGKARLSLTCQNCLHPGAVLTAGSSGVGSSGPESLVSDPSNSIGSPGSESLSTSWGMPGGILLFLTSSVVLAWAFADPLGNCSVSLSWQSAKRSELDRDGLRADLGWPLAFAFDSTCSSRGVC